MYFPGEALLFLERCYVNILELLSDESPLGWEIQQEFLVDLPDLCAKLALDAVFMECTFSFQSTGLGDFQVGRSGRWIIAILYHNKGPSIPSHSSFSTGERVHRAMGSMKHPRSWYTSIYAQHRPVHRFLERRMC